MTDKKQHFMTRKQGLYLKDTKTKGRGVFCKTAIRAGEVLEITPALLLNEADTNRVDKTVLANYTFSIGKISKRYMKAAKMKNPANCSSVVMGVGSFCNHAENNNAEIVWEEKAGTVYYILRAIRAIPKNTEICTSYGEGWFDTRD